MVETKKLSLEELKQKAGSIQKGEAVEKITGGDWSDCHGYWGQLHKVIRGEIPLFPMKHDGPIY
jgi:hypothetical protein